jgi:peroxiredoxin
LKDKGLVVLSISADDARTASQVKPYIQRMGYTFPVLQDKDSAVIAMYNAQKTLPFTVVIDRNQQVSEVSSGFNPGDEVHLRTKVAELLAKPAP